MTKKHTTIHRSGGRWRSALVLVCFAAAVAAIEARVLYLQLVDREFLTAQGDDRYLRTVQMSAHRGSILDRHGEPLAVSTPVDSIWVNPGELKPELGRLAELASVLGLDPDVLARRVTSNMEREFVYLRRHLSPAKATGVLSLGLPGVRTLREFRRYYPAGEVAGHVLGFTNIDDQGQEGLELGFDHWLTPEIGSKRVIQDRLGRVVGDVEQIKPARDGNTLRTSLDLRLQYLAYRELKRAVTENSAQSGSVVILDPFTGEVLAIVNQPSYNPNDRSQLDVSRYRNRAVTDILEPGSSFKPFILAAALESGLYSADTLVDTSPGILRVNGRVLTEDTSNLGVIDVTTVLARSSNVGAAHIALSMDAESLWRVLTRFGIGRLTDSGFPGESAGVLNEPRHWRAIGQATLAYGYGLSVTALQLARAYSAIAAGGVLPSVSFLALDEPPPGERVISESTASDLLGMLQAVVAPGGTARRAAISNYTVAGKTGTARKSGVGGYLEDRYTAIFGGIAPATDPRLVVVVVIDEPRSGAYYGGQVAAPVFARIVQGALRQLAVAPDALAEPPGTAVASARVDP
ncbi:peptidoglycan D,D-transpeptidase FtsI family protein [Candidatus Rariloculus sp.]|uniref:peptidoglycan D,D-transpeptidase FtsI family protein n=1 Tax=Candidatus Rariloculus sp. TaxID=3101265 RepID=UPI003D0E2055